MKLSTFGLGLAVAASSLVSISSLSQSAAAATIGAENGSFTFNGTWVFSFISSNGNFQSTFGIGSKPSSATTPLFAEQNQQTPSIVSPSSATYTFDGSETDFFLSTQKPTNIATIFSSNAHLVSAGGFLITNLVDGSRKITINDSFRGDRDFNDFIVNARPVPVPAIVPGIALAAAFFGSKALKRNKKEASESVA